MEASLSIKEACEVLRVSHVTVYNEIKAGRLKSFKVRRRRFITMKALQAYIREREKEAA